MAPGTVRVGDRASLRRSAVESNTAACMVGLQAHLRDAGVIPRKVSYRVVTHILPESDNTCLFLEQYAERKRLSVKGHAL
jgi:hypothetical protein